MPMTARPLAPAWVPASLGVALVVLPSIVSQVLSPEWFATGDSTVASDGLAVWGILLGVSGSCVVLAGGWVGASVGLSSSSGFLIQMFGGVAAGMWGSIMWLGYGGAHDAAVFVATVAALFVGIPYWILAGVGLIVGSAIYQSRTPQDQQLQDQQLSDQQVEERIRSGYFEPSSDVSTESGLTSIGNLESGDRFTDSSGQLLEVIKIWKEPNGEILITVQTSSGQGVRRWHRNQVEQDRP